MPEPKGRYAILVARRASCRVANAFFDQIKVDLAEIQSQNHQNVQKMHFLAKIQESMG